MADDFTLASDFAPPTREQWLAAVDRALKGASFEKLVSTTDDGLRVQPLYTAEDVATSQDEAGFPGFDPLLRGGQAAPRPNGGWDIRSSIIHPDPTIANAQALADLANGATSVDLVVLAAADVPRLLAGIDLSAAPVALRPHTADSLATARAVLAHIEDCPGASGTLGLDPLLVDVAAAATLAARVADSHQNLRTFRVSGAPFADAGGSEAQEVGYLLASATHVLRELVAAGLTVEQAARQIELEITADVDIFATIAKIRSLRFTWATVLRESGLTFASYREGVVHIGAVSSYRTLTVIDPWVNLLRGTAACLGAVFGGADVVTLAPFDSAEALPGDLGRRLARNTQLILANESGIGRVLDPAGGSWYVESLTDAFSEKAWENFQAVEAAGGPIAAMPMMARQLAEVAARRDLAVASRKRPITGVSEFPFLGEQRPERIPTPAPPAGPLPRRRLAEPFERLRATGESAGATVFLANLGPVAVHTARATFASNLFATGGVRAVSACVDADCVAAEFVSSGAAVACICSSDEVYTQQAASVAAALKMAGARRVYLAGKVEVPGVDETVALGANVLDVIARLHDAMRITKLPIEEIA